MAEDTNQTEPTPTTTETPTETPTETETATARPADIPEKFWDPEAGTVRTESLIKSYNELERRMGDPAVNTPDSPDAYEISPPEGFEDLLASDPDVNARLHAAGFTQEQAALVYELAAERLMPLAQHVVSDVQTAGEARLLAQHFGGDARWQTLKPQIEAWGKSNLGGAAFDAMSRTAGGVIAIHRMMTSSEPAVLRGGGGNSDVLSEAELRRKMEDPRYWRDEDPAYVAEVRRGFEALYPN